MSYNYSQQEFEEILSKKEGLIFFKKVASDIITPVLAYQKLSPLYKNSYLFESVEKGNNKGRFSLIGIDPDIVWHCKNDQSFINNDFANNKESFTKQNGKVLDNLRQFIKESQINWQDLQYNNSPLPAMCGGVFGYMGYDMINQMEDLKLYDQIDELNIPDSIFIRPQIIIVFDNLFDCALICAPIFKNSQNKQYEFICEKITRIQEILNNNSTHKAKEILSDEIHFDFQSNFSENEYCQIVEKCKDFIKQGDIFQVLPSQRFTAKFPKNLSEFNFYRSLRAINPSPFLFFLKFDDFVICGSSPEIMTSLKSNTVTIRPLAGTRKRGKNRKEDQEIAQELLNDQKELAEHLMLIDLGRHDVGRVAQEGTVVVTEKMIIENYSHVMHISSNVEGQLRKGLDALDVLISGFPAGTVSGAPKIRAMEIISEIEKTKRSFYAGCVGYFSANGDMETCITLRSALIKDQKIYLQAGAGVVYDSIPKLEYQECINKAMALVKACKKISDYQ